MQRDELIKQYCLMMDDYNQISKIWRRPEFCKVNEILDDFLSEYDPQFKATKRVDADTQKVDK